MTYTFTPEQEAWLRDLETTDEKQAESLLHDTNKGGYCCLGRACIVLDIEEDQFGCFDGKDDELPDYAASRLRLRSQTGRLAAQFQSRGQYFIDLADMNDKGMSFKEIAAYIRANPENVFLPPED